MKTWHFILIAWLIPVLLTFGRPLYICTIEAKDSVRNVIPFDEYFYASCQDLFSFGGDMGGIYMESFMITGAWIAVPLTVLFLIFQPNVELSREGQIIIHRKEPMLWLLILSLGVLGLFALFSGYFGHFF